MTSIFKNVAELFGKTVAPSNQTPQPQNSAPIGTPPVLPGPQKNEEPIKSPMDNYEEVFKIAETNAAANQNPLESPLFNTDMAKFNEQVAAMDFTAGIAPELLAKAQSGDTAALVQVIQLAGQRGYAENATLTTRLVEAGVSQRIKQLQNSLPEHIRQSQTREAIHGNKEAAILNHPAVAPLVAGVQKNFSAAHPNATSAEIAEMAVQYFTEMAKSLVPPQKQTATQQASVESQDFSSFFNQ